MKKINNYKYYYLLAMGLVMSISMGDLHAAIFPSKGKMLQDKAPDKIEFIVLESRSEMIKKKGGSKYDMEDDVEVFLKVKVMSAERTSKGLKKDQTIEIRYTSRSSLVFPLGDWASVLPAGKIYDGFLNFKEEDESYSPAAHSYSFVKKRRVFK